MKLGYGGLLMLNMQEIIETDIKKLDQMEARHRCTSANVRHLFDGLDLAQARRADVLCAWGEPGQQYVRSRERRGVKSVKTAFYAACKRAGLEGVSPYVHRHTAAVWMAADGVSMDKTAQ